MSKDYKDTLQLPSTSFPMRAGLAKKEPELLKYWDSMGLYEKMQEKNADCPAFILHDGPPYANANIHIGTAFNKILKDFVPKYKTMSGFRSPYVPGWDTHGLPIELKVLKSAEVDKDNIDPLELRKLCMKYAYKYVDVQRKEFIRLGVLGDWQDPYITMKPEYEAKQLEVFAEIVDKDLVYKGKKPVYWCTDCQTALATAEIEYKDVSSPSAFVAYQMDKSFTMKYDELMDKDVYVVIWTTTPWTLPASMAVALHASYKYGVYCNEGKCFLMAVDLAKPVGDAVGIDFGEPVMTFLGADLEGEAAHHPYLDREVKLVLAGYVTLDSGTGFVHTAPGHGVDDYETGMRYGIEVYNPVDDAGFFVKDTPVVGGMSIDDGAKRVLEVLKENGRLLGLSKISHSYPHCWRCRQPVIFRSTGQWFINVAKFRDRALEIIDNDVNWIPAWGRDRIYNMVRDRSDWCISRQRVWGVPIPSFTCEDCGETILTAGNVRAVAQWVAKETGSAWWAHSSEDLLGDLCVCPKCGSKNLKKDNNIMDVWFDSGVSHFAVLETRDDLRWPADLYLEGSDQHRGWFQTSLLTSVATRNVAPFKEVLTHGFVLDGQGYKMSKSLGNSVAPQEVIDQYGADILRLWAASTDYRNDVKISTKIMDALSEEYRRIRNTARFLLGNLHGFDPRVNGVSMEEMSEFDRWVLNRLNQVIARVTAGYEECEFHVPNMAVYQFCVNELSSVYLDANKDRLYADAVDGTSRRACQTVMWKLLVTLDKMLAPVLSFTAEEIWQSIRAFDPSLPESVFLSDWPVIDEELKAQSEELEEKWGKILTLRSSVSKALEVARASGLIGQSLEASVVVKAPEGFDGLLSDKDWAMVNIVSGFAFGDAKGEADEEGIAVDVSKAEGDKCPRCWRYEVTSHGDHLCARCAEVLGV